MSSVTAQPADVEERRYFGTSKYGWRVVLFSGAGWFFDGYVINVWPLAIPFVMTDLHLTVANIGTITTIYVIAYTPGHAGRWNLLGLPWAAQRAVLFGTLLHVRRRPYGGGARLLVSGLFPVSDRHWHRDGAADGFDLYHRYGQ